jgi:hypothetical protein
MIAANVLMATLIGCPTTQVLNNTEEWNAQDKQALKTATYSCSVQYDNSPCLKMFKKIEEGVYQALCGAKTK